MCNIIRIGFVLSICIAVASAVKPGFCPTSDNLGVCANLCYEDEGCGGTMKCCLTGCGGSSCQEPVFIENAGKCPDTSGIITTCQFNPAVNCFSDTQCSKGQKCCSFGCGKVCLNTV